MYARETIAAIATPVGVGGIAIVRVSGDDARSVASRVFRGFPAAGPESHRLYLGRLVDAGGSVLDRGLAVMMRAPRSYTGEDVLELHCHGGSVAVRSVLAATLAAGARAARAGEFTLRAFLNGKLDLAQAEAVADLVGARTAEAARVANAQLDGELSRGIEAHRQALIGVAARLEAAIDFADEDDVALDASAVEAELERVGMELRQLAGSFRSGRLLREGARVVFAGRPNVGKSSLMNRLLGTDRIIVTAEPGTTRDTIEEVIDLDGMPVVLVDTAGIRESDAMAERFGIERTREAIATADVVVWVLDGEDDGADMTDATQHGAQLMALNKADKRAVAASVTNGGTTAVPSSAIGSPGVDALRREIGAALRRFAPAETSLTVTRERHSAALERAAECVTLALAALRASHPAEVVAVDVGGALEHLNEIVGISAPDEILDRVFREFCIGK